MCVGLGLRVRVPLFGRCGRASITPQIKKSGGRVFSLDATFGLLATRRRLGRRGDSSAIRSAFVV